MKIVFDIIIKNGTIIDGTGATMYRADVGIREDRVEKIGELHNEKADRVIDAQGKFVCPGFIDVNNHSDTYWQIFLNPNLESLLYQGITTVVGGNCGSSLAPLVDAKNIETIQKWTDISQTNVNWLSMAEFLSYVEKRPLSVNFATLTGHATLRRGILRDEMRNPNPKELAYMKKSLADSMKEGSFGLSSGLIYTHARMATEDELIDLAKVVQKYDGVYTTHIRSEKEEIMEAVEESVRVAEKSNAKIHISHLKVMGEDNWPKMEDILNIIEHARTMNGTDITFDIFPYTSAGPVLYALLPSWVSEGGKKMMLGRLRDKDVRTKLTEEMKQSGFDWGKIEIAISPLNKTLARRKISEIAKSQEKTVEEAVIDMLLASEGRVITSIEVLSEDNIKNAILHPFSIVATNGSGYALEHSQSGEMVHPRCFGTFIRILERYVREEKLLSWEEAIRKMTSVPANKFGIKERGRVIERCIADILVIDPEKVSSLSSSENPYQYAKGIDHMLINGNLVLDGGNFTGARKGMVLRHK